MSLGVTHATAGLAIGAVTAPWAPMPDTLPGRLAWTAVVGGMAMLPDLDHRGATVARMWGWPSRWAAGAVGGVAGGHRWGTHDLILGPAVFAALAWAAAWWHPTRMLVIAIAIGLALRACHFVVPGRAETTIVGNLAMSWSAAWWLTTNTTPAATAWLPAAVAVGVVAHIIMDAPTEAGIPVPIRWRATRARLVLPQWIAWTTGHLFERAVLLPAVTAAATAAVWWTVTTAPA